MSSRKVIYGVLIVIGFGAAAAVRYARYNDIDVPWWVFVLGVPLIVALIALDVRSRRSSRSSGTSGDQSRQGTGTNA